MASDESVHLDGGWAPLEGAPPEIALARDLANSLDERTFHPHASRHDRRDLLETVADLEAWLRYRGFEVEVTDEDVVLARGLRDAVRLAAMAHVDRRVTDEARAALDEVSSQLPLRVAMADGAGLRVEAAGTGVRGVLGGILAVAAGSGLEAWSRLKMCAAADCHWVFFDRSKPRTGRWCEMAVCGNRVKTREYRRRRAS